MEDKFLKNFYHYKDDIYRLAYSYLGNYNDTDDVVQIVFMKLYKNINKIDNIKGWLIKVTINECKTYFLSSWYKKHILLSNEDIDVEKEEVTDELLEEIMKLDRKYRLIIYLCYYQNYKIKEIALLLKMKENTVKTNLVRAREKLRYYLEEDKDE